MPKEKDLKRLVRARMQKTGESYTAARARVLAKSAARERTPLPADYATLAGMSDDAVLAKTGKDWPAWVSALDLEGAFELSHRDIAKLVGERYGLSGWWAQTVTVGYERLRGLRDVHQRRDGAYEASKSRTYPVPVEVLYAAFATARGRAPWLGSADLSVRTSTRPKSVRFDAAGDERVETWFESKGPSKSRVSVQHRNLADRAAVEATKALWGERLDALRDALSR